jgi:glycerophosphoryl diester phosphodiesterase
VIERKSGDPGNYVETIRSCGLVDSVFVTSFDWDFLVELHALEPRIALGAIGKDELAAEQLARLQRVGILLVHWRWEDLTIESVRELHRRGYLVAAYTMDSDAAMLGGIRMGLDGLTTNRPARLQQVLAMDIGQRR